MRRRHLSVAVVLSMAAPLIGGATGAASATKQRATVSADVARLLSSTTSGSTANSSLATVIVRFRQQADVRRPRSGTRQQRQKSLIDELHTVADTTQLPLRLLLKVRQLTGGVARFQPLWVINGLSVTASPDVITELALRPEVASITSDAADIVTTTLPPVPATASADSAVVKAPALWSQGFYGQGVVVADLDSGVDATHPDLAGSYRGGTNSWFDPYSQHATPTDKTGHGTATTGIMVAGDATGTTIGVAPGAKWIAAKIFNDAGGATVTAIHQAMQWVLDPDANPATADAPQVVNNSWAYGTPGCNLTFQSDLQAMRAAGIIPVFAAGNYGPNAGTSVSPANYPEALAVGSTDNTDAIDPQTGVGPSACGETSTTYPDVVAPGFDIYSTDLFHTYYWGSGTSFAAPHVAGAIALLLSAVPTAGATVEAALETTAVDLGAAGPDNIYGHGRIDTAAALLALQAAPPPPTTTTAPPTTTTTLPPDTTTTTTLPPDTIPPTTVPSTSTTTLPPDTTTTTTLPPDTTIPPTTTTIPPTTTTIPPTTTTIPPTTTTIPPTTTTIPPTTTTIPPTTTTIPPTTTTTPVQYAFADGFESGLLPGAWSSISTTTTTRLNVAAAGSLVGSFGLRAQGNSTNFVQYNYAPTAPVYDARFYFRPNANKSTSEVVFEAATTSSFSTSLFKVRYRLSGTTPQVQLQVGSSSNSTWTNLTGGTTNNVIEVVWQAVAGGGPAAGTVRLIVNGLAAQTLTTTSKALVGSIRLGAVSGGSSNIVEYFDAFASKRNASPLIGA